jgi:hypothetical protein
VDGFAGPFSRWMLPDFMNEELLINKIENNII